MPVSLFSTPPDFGKYAAFLMAVLLLVYSASGLKVLVAKLLLKLYEILIQKGALP